MDCSSIVRGKPRANSQGSMTEAKSHEAQQYKVTNNQSFGPRKNTKRHNTSEHTNNQSLANERIQQNDTSRGNEPSEFGPRKNPKKGTTNQQQRTIRVWPTKESKRHDTSNYRTIRFWQRKESKNKHTTSNNNEQPVYDLQKNSNTQKHRFVSISSRETKTGAFRENDPRPNPATISPSPSPGPSPSPSTGPRQSPSPPKGHNTEPPSITNSQT